MCRQFKPLRENGDLEIDVRLKDCYVHKRFVLKKLRLVFCLDNI